MGCTHIFIYFQLWEEPIHQLLLEHILGSLPNRGTSLDPKSQIKKNYTSLCHTFSVRIHGIWTLGKLYGIKLRCYWECLGGTTWELEEPYRRKHEDNSQDLGKGCSKDDSQVPKQKGPKNFFEKITNNWCLTGTR
jgi:hypothetical protein